MTEFQNLYVLRHGQTEWNAEGRHQGRLDSPLTDLGRRQAAAQGRILATEAIDPARTGFWSSPQGRAWDTATICLGHIGQRPVADDRLCEVSFGEWEGLSSAEVDAGWPGSRDATNWFNWHFSAPGGENLAAMRARVTAFLSDLTRPAVIVCHGITSRVLRGVWLGLGPDDMGTLPGGQGVVYRLREGKQTLLEDPGAP